MATESDFHATVGSEGAAVHFENSMLTQPKTTLPSCAQDVLDGRGASPGYWAWLIETFRACDVGLRPYCNVCGWRRGGRDSWDGIACKCGKSA